MSKVTQADLVALGEAIKLERGIRNLTLDSLGFEVLGRENAKGYVSKIEKGQKQLSIRIAAKFVQFLDLDKALLLPFAKAPEIDDEITLEDKRVEELMRMRDDDPDAPESTEELLIALADEFAGEEFDNTFDAYQSLRAALIEAAEMKRRGNLPQNLDDQLQSVMREVAKHNDAGDRQAGQDAISDALRNLDAEAKTAQAEVERIKATRIAAFNLGFDQAMIRNDPEMGADMIVKRLTLEARPEGLFYAIVSETNALTQKYTGQVSRFAQKVQVILGRGNLKRAKGDNRGWAAMNLSIDLSVLAYQKQAGAEIDEAIKLAKDAIKFSQETKNKRMEARALGQYAIYLRLVFERMGGDAPPEMEPAARRAHGLLNKNIPFQITDRAAIFEGFGSVMSHLGMVHGDAARLSQAIEAFDQAEAHYQKAWPDFAFRVASARADKALAHLRRGRISDDLGDLNIANKIYEAIAKSEKDKQPYHWAIGQWNLADLVFAHCEITKDMDRLETAQKHLNDARKVFEQGLSEYQLNKCDELQEQIDAARAK